MTRSEFSDKFDTLVDSYRRFTDFDGQEAPDTLDFNEYEKSVFLTKAQDQLVIEMYNGFNVQHESFEQTEELRRNLDRLVKTSTLTEKTSEIPGKISTKSKFFTLPVDHMFTVYEAATLNSTDSCLNGKTVVGVPVTHDEYDRVSKNPFRWAKGSRVHRLNVENNLIEVVSDVPISSYFIRYVSSPSPIILVDLPSGVSIKGVSKATECALHETMHQKILDRAVNIALSSRSLRSKQ